MELGELGWPQQRVRGAGRQRRDLGPMAAQPGRDDRHDGEPASIPASATTCAGAGGAGLPLPHVASSQFGRAASGASATCTISVAELSAVDSTPCGMKPPRIAAATIAANRTRHLIGMKTGYGCRLKAS